VIFLLRGTKGVRFRPLLECTIGITTFWAGVDIAVYLPLDGAVFISCASSSLSLESLESLSELESEEVSLLELELELELLELEGFCLSSPPFVSSAASSSSHALKSELETEELLSSLLEPSNVVCLFGFLASD